MLCKEKYLFSKKPLFNYCNSYTPEMTKDWGSIVEEEEEKGRRMQTRGQTNSRYNIIYKIKQQLGPVLKYTK